MISSIKKFDSALPGNSQSISEAEEKELSGALARTRKRLGKLFKPNQILGRKGAIGCVSVEISQRCNLDCTLCYLSPSSNDVVDLPLQEVFSRLRQVRENFGVGANVQISGGDPTLRERRELVRIVRYAREVGLNPALFTNGIRCSRDLLVELADNGLSDVAFHVDMTQERKGFRTEEELNAVRLEYIERARGLPLMVIFNTTAHRQNFREIPALARFFIHHADVVGFASFQLQADTGRGILGKRPDVISLQTVKQKIDEGAGNKMGWDAFLIGHPKCHSYAPALVVNDKAYSMVDDPKLVGAFLENFSHVAHDRRERPPVIAGKYIRAALRRPRWLIRGLNHCLPRLWNIRKELVAARGKVRKISFFVQNFMDSKNLDPERIKGCSFMVMTPDGPLSMCAHNARRDDHILRPIPVHGESGVEMFDPLKKPGVFQEVSV